MDPLQTLKTALQRIPPVGNPISLQQGPLVHPLFAMANAQTYQSGTAALAAALLVAKMAAAKNRQPLANPEVIVPAYACPDLISAVMFAGCHPVLVDIEPDMPYLQLDGVSQKLSAQTVAVIAPWFLGIPERITALRERLQGHAALLIEDSAQWFPDAEPTQTYNGDLVILSFGKGKPVSLLGGGLLYDPRGTLRSEFPASQATGDTSANKLRLKFVAYNLVVSRFFYWMIELLPFIQMGKTVYKPLATLENMSTVAQGFLQPNIDAYFQRSRRAETGLKQLLGDLGMLDCALCQQAPTYQQQRMLRFPLLVKTSRMRNELLSALQNAGLGASGFYPAPLNEIENIPAVVKTQGPFPNAKSFAERLITLPTHVGCNTGALLSIRNLLAHHLRSQTQ